MDDSVQQAPDSWQEETIGLLAEKRNILSGVRLSLDSMARGVDAMRRDANGEVIANIRLAQRHIEDARMRLGVADATLKGYDPWAHIIIKETAL